MSDCKLYIEKHQSEFYKDLFTLISIPSVSSHKDKQAEISRCADQWVSTLLNYGMDQAYTLETKGNPVVYAEKRISEELPTILIYGHYDVMPAEPLELWTSNPFEAVIRDGKIFARGADDDKGQSFMHIAALRYLIQSDLLNSNIKFLIEGEEEIGSPSLEEFCLQNKTRLSCDTILVSDTSMLSAETPSITTGLRGLGYWEIEVTGPNRDLHSGIFGGAVANPINELTRILGNLTTAEGKVNIPGFYDQVQELSEREKELIDLIPFDEQKYKQNLGVNKLHGETGYSTVERTGVRPTLDICGIWGGYTGEGSKTVLPSKAFAKISCRLVPGQNPEMISRLIMDHIQSLTPDSIQLNIRSLNSANSYVCPIDSKAYLAAEAAYSMVFGKTPLPVRRGGSIGVVPIFEKILGVKPLLIGFGLESDATHSPNENFPVDLFIKGIETIAEFHKIFSSR